jgi:hypothetical protein
MNLFGRLIPSALLSFSQMILMLIVLLLLKNRQTVRGVFLPVMKSDIFLPTTWLLAYMPMPKVPPIV